MFKYLKNRETTGKTSKDFKRMADEIKLERDLENMKIDAIRKSLRGRLTPEMERRIRENENIRR